MLASIRFFYKDAATNNEFRIDTTRIYIGGVSAGAIAALQIAHFDDLQEVPIGMDTLLQANGGFEGNSGNPGYSRDIAGEYIRSRWMYQKACTPFMHILSATRNTPSNKSSFTKCQPDITFATFSFQQFPQKFITRFGI